MLSLKPNFCQKPQKAFPVCKTSFFQCIPPKWTNTYALVCTAHDRDVSLSHQSFIASITTVVQIKRGIQLTSILTGPKGATETKTNEAQVLLSYVTKDHLKTLLVTKKNLLKAIVILQNQINSLIIVTF
jgi:hypothetical protein